MYDFFFNCSWICILSPLLFFVRLQLPQDGRPRNRTALRSGFLIFGILGILPEGDVFPKAHTTLEEQHEQHRPCITAELGYCLFFLIRNGQQALLAHLSCVRPRRLLRRALSSRPRRAARGPRRATSSALRSTVPWRDVMRCDIRSKEKKGVTVTEE